MTRQAASSAPSARSNAQCDRLSNQSSTNLVHGDRCPVSGERSCVVCGWLSLRCSALRPPLASAVGRSKRSAVTAFRRCPFFLSVLSCEVTDGAT